MIASGLAKEPASRGKRVAFGDGKRVLHDGNAEPILRYSPHIVWPNEPLTASNVEWIPFFKGSRQYSRQEGNRWVFNRDFRVIPGEFYFQPYEHEAVELLRLPRKFIVIEPHAKRHLQMRAAYLANKEWPFRQYQSVVDAMVAGGHAIVQFVYGSAPRLRNVWTLQTPNFRAAAAILARAELVITTEGGMHHAAAALGVPAVVLFGGWLPPAILGYDMHINLTGGETEACGSLTPCAHCRAAMERISVDEVLEATHRQLRRGK